MVLAGGMASNLLTGSVKNLWPTEKGSIYFYLENKKTTRTDLVAKKVSFQPKKDDENGFRRQK